MNATSRRTDSFSREHQRVLPASSEPIARAVVDFLGGPVGRYAPIGRGRWWTPLRVLVALSLSFLSLAYMAKAACLSGRRDAQGVPVLDWEGSRQYTAACYNDILPLYSGRGLDAPGFPYAFQWQEDGITRYMEYPVLAGIFQGAMGALARTTYDLVALTGLVIPEASWYFTLTALAVSGLWVVTIAMVSQLAGNRVWDVVLVAASPLVVVHAFTNWDIPSITLTVAAMWAVSRQRVGLAGIFIGLGTAFKLWPLFLLGAYGVLAVRTKRLPRFFYMVVTALASWCAVNIPVMLAYPAAWHEFLRLNSERSWEWTTIWAVVSRRFGWEGFDVAGDPVILNFVTLALFVISCAAIAAVGLSVARRPRVAELVYLIIAAFLLFNKVWSPQYSLWLVVPAVLALPRWRLLLSWMLADAAVWPILMWHMLGTENKGAPGWLLDVAVLTRDGFIVAIGVLIIQQMYGRTLDKVDHANEAVDLLAGPFRGVAGKQVATTAPPGT